MNETAEAPATPRRKWTQVRWKRVVLALALIFACMGLLEAIVWYFEPWYFAHEMSRDHASLSVTPETIHDSNSSKLNSARLQCFEYSFQVLWEQIESRKDAKTVSVIKFKDGATIIAFDAASMSSLSKGPAGPGSNLGTRLRFTCSEFGLRLDGCGVAGLSRPDSLVGPERQCARRGLARPQTDRGA
jgi:hypothetical protein